jgi:hypothetical protein
VETLQQYSAAETERMMKLRDVLLKAMAKKIGGTRRKSLGSRIGPCGGGGNGLNAIYAVNAVSGSACAIPGTW